MNRATHRGIGGDRDAPDEIHGIARVYGAVAAGGDGEDRLAGTGGGGRGGPRTRGGQRHCFGPAGIRRGDPRRPASLDLPRGPRGPPPPPGARGRRARWPPPQGAVRVGTRFVAAEEAGTHPAYVDKLIAAEAKDTILTEAFSANWPNAPHRVLRSCVEAVDRFRGEIVGQTSQPWAPDVRVAMHPRDSFVADPGTTGEIDAMRLLARGAVGGVKGVRQEGASV